MNRKALVIYFSWLAPTFKACRKRAYYKWAIIKHKQVFFFGGGGGGGCTPSITIQTEMLSDFDLCQRFDNTIIPYLFFRKTQTTKAAHFSEDGGAISPCQLGAWVQW